MEHGGSLEELDSALTQSSREDAALRLRLGQVLEVLSRGGGCFELGFSSIGAYALERAERSMRWAEGARCVARRLDGLPQLRAALATGRLSWSMGELLARVADAQNETEWLLRAQGRTLREVRAFCENMAEEASGTNQSGNLTSEADEPETEPCLLTCSLDREDAWLFESTRVLLEALGARGGEEQAQALLAEGQDTLLAALPPGTLSLGKLALVDEAQSRWFEQLRRWRNEAEVRCEPQFRERVTSSSPPLDEKGMAGEAARGCASLANKSAAELDGLVRELATALAAHELRLSRLLLNLHRVDGWRRLGYATEGQYARERLGLSRSSLSARRALALRLERLPRLAAALEEGRIGVEAALQLVRVATANTEVEWVERAQRRTVKHLREEVGAALTVISMSGESDCPPPRVQELETYHELERSVVSGRACLAFRENNGQRAAADDETHEREANTETVNPVAPDGWFQVLRSLSCWLERGVQFSAAGPGSRSSSGRVVIRLRMSRETRAWWRALELQAQRWLPRGMSWLKFLCLCVWRSWRHSLGVPVAYGRIYIRDRHICSSPVCTRRDVTPHHLVFRSLGGGDEPENITSICTWCHLFGVHGGRIRACGPASRIRWELGPPQNPCLRVEGRERRAA